jgi:hypothetical protein
MKITAILNAYDVPVTLDTLDSIRYHMTDQVLVLVDGVAWNSFKNVELPAHKLKGLNHGWFKAPYRNIMLSLLTAYRNFPTTDWYCYLEHDCLITSSNFKKDLIEAERDNIWCLGSDFRRNQELKVDLSYLEKIIKDKLEEYVYLLGSCIFYHRNFIKLAVENEFFDKFLFYTNEFKNGFFPFYTAWDLTEHVLPSIVKYYGGEILQLSVYNEDFKKWAGNYRRYPIRYRPDIEYEPELFLQASIIHPIKRYTDPIRDFYRARRQKEEV